MAHTYDDINNWYNQYLGHTVGGQDSGWATWANDPNAENNIKNSAEGQAYAANGSQPAASQPPSAQDQWSAPAQPYNAALGTDENYFNSLFKPGQISSADLQAHAADLAAHGMKYNGGDTITNSQGQTVDVLGDWNKNSGMGENQWLVQGAGGSGGSGGGGSATGGGGASSLNFSSTTNPQDDALRAQLIAQLTARSQQSLAIDPTDPNIKQQVDPFRAEQDRSQRNYMADLAEKAGQNYGASNLTGQDRLSQEKAGQNTGNFQASLIGKELDSRRQEIQAALTGEQGILTEDQRNQLQMQLAQLNDATQRLGIQTQANTAANQNALGFSQLDWNTSPFNPNNIPNFNG